MKTSKMMLTVVTFGLGALLTGCGMIGEVGTGDVAEERQLAADSDMYFIEFGGFKVNAFAHMDMDVFPNDPSLYAGTGDPVVCTTLIGWLGNKTAEVEATEGTFPQYSAFMYSKAQLSSSSEGACIMVRRAGAVYVASTRIFFPNSHTAWSGNPVDISGSVLGHGEKVFDRFEIRLRRVGGDAVTETDLGCGAGVTEGDTKTNTACDGEYTCVLRHPGPRDPGDTATHAWSCVAEEPAAGGDGPSCGGECPLGQICSVNYTPAKCIDAALHEGSRCPNGEGTTCNTAEGFDGLCVLKTYESSLFPEGDPNHLAEYLKCESTGLDAVGQENYCANKTGGCGHEQGGCSDNAHCKTGLKCLRDFTKMLADNYHPVRYCYDVDHCSKRPGGKCSAGETGCKNNDECPAGYECDGSGAGAQHYRDASGVTVRTCVAQRSSTPSPKHVTQNTVAEGPDCATLTHTCDGDQCLAGQCCFPAGDANTCWCNGFQIGAGHTCQDVAGGGDVQPGGGGVQPGGGDVQPGGGGVQPGGGGPAVSNGATACTNAYQGSRQYWRCGTQGSLGAVIQVCRGEGTNKNESYPCLAGGKCFFYTATTIGSCNGFAGYADSMSDAISQATGRAAAAVDGAFIPMDESASTDVAGGCAMAPGASAPTGLGLLLLGLLALRRRGR